MLMYMINAFPFSAIPFPLTDCTDVADRETPHEGELWPMLCTRRSSRTRRIVMKDWRFTMLILTNSILHAVLLLDHATAVIFIHHHLLFPQNPTTLVHCYLRYPHTRQRFLLTIPTTRRRRDFICVLPNPIVTPRVLVFCVFIPVIKLFLHGLRRAQRICPRRDPALLPS